MADDVRVEVRCQWCYGDGEETVVLGERAFKRPCHRCDGKKSVTAWLVGRDALVYRLGVAHLAWEDAAEIAGKVDTVDEWAKVGLADSRRLAALSALRARDDAHGRTDG